MPKARIIVVDDEEGIRTSLSAVLRDEGFIVEAANDGQQALEMMQQDPFDLVMLDVWMPGLDGVETLQRIRANFKETAIIMISGHARIEDAVKATKLGAYNFVEKPLSLDKVVQDVKQALKQRHLEKENRMLKKSIKKHYQIVGQSQALQDLQIQIARAAPSNGWVLITGEHGSGKELTARAIHDQSHRKNGPFIEMNCAAIPEDLIESELFGHEKGSFTGATNSKKGKFELANNGTLFLDEIGDMTLRTQAKVLRVLQERSFQKVGGQELIQTDLRIIAASNRNLITEIQNGNFREDLFYRLNVIPILVPPLRERREDIPILIDHFIQQFCIENGQTKKILTKTALQILIQRDWPGNVRELKNIIERLVIMVPKVRIETSDVDLYLGQGSFESSSLETLTKKPLKEIGLQAEKKHIIDVLGLNDGNISRTAEQLGVSRKSLYDKMKILGIKRAEKP